VELHTLDFVAAVTEAHDDAVVSFGGDGELAGQGFSFNDERVVARGGQRVGKFEEDVSAVVMDLAGFAVKELGGANDFSAEGRANGLMTEANSKDGKFPCQALDELHRDTCILRGARAGRNHDAFRLAARDLLDSDSVIAMDFDIAAEFAEVLREVVGERIVVVQKQNHLTSLPDFPGLRLPARSAKLSIC
jgi:hypothetical protein